MSSKTNSPIYEKHSNNIRGNSCGGAADISDLPTLRCFDFDDKFLPAVVRKDLSEKPSFHAFRTLATLVGAHAKISYKETDNICRADWIAPDGQPVCALWLKRGLPKKTELSLSADKFKIMEISGKIIENDNAKGKTKLGVKLSITPIYIIGAKNITL